MIATSLGFTKVPLPMADCPNCLYSTLPNEGGHCYMFKEKPGERCGQMKEKP